MKLKVKIIAIIAAVFVVAGVITLCVSLGKKSGGSSETTSASETVSSTERETNSESEETSASETGKPSEGSESDSVSASENESEEISDSESAEESESNSENESESAEESESNSENESESAEESESSDESVEESESESVHTHKYDKEVAMDKYKVSAATCYKKAKYYYSCECGEAGKETFEAGSFAPHVTVVLKGRAATCTESGLTDGKICGVCNKVLEAQNIVPALGHNFANYVSDGNATCLTDGTKTGVCTRCGATDTVTDVGTAKGHTYSEEWSIEGNYHFHRATCEHADLVSDKEEHTANDFICGVCGNDGAFDCGVKLSLDSETDTYSVIGRSADDKKVITIKPYYGGKKVTKIGESAFSLTDITDISIPDTIERIWYNAFDDKKLNTNKYGNASYIGNEENKYLVLLKAENTSIETCTINENTKIIAGMAFENCSKLTSIIIPASVRIVESYAFRYCSELTSIEMNEGLKVLGEFAFGWCSSLKKITLPTTIEKIERCAFVMCPNIENIGFNSGMYWVNNYMLLNNIILDTAQNKVVFGCKYANLTGVPFPYSIEIIGDTCFGGSGITEIEIPETVKIIEEYAFSQCKNLTGIVIPDNVTTIGHHAFYNCVGLSSLSIGKNVSTIGDMTFASCNELTSVTLPKSVTSIGANAFAYCDKLSSVNYEGTMKEWSAVTSGKTPFDGTQVTVIKCSDGEVAL